VLGLLVPIRESGSLIPQLFIGSAARQLSVRKWLWVLGSLFQGLCVAGIALVAMFLDGHLAGWTMLGLVALFSLARGACSIASKDVLGKTIPKARRGQLTGWSAGFAGLITVAIGIVLVLSFSLDDQPRLLGLLLFGAALLWAAAAFSFALIKEPAGGSASRRSFSESLGKLQLLVTDRPFRRFIATRALLMCSALSAPFYVALAHDSRGGSTTVLGGFVVAAGLASLLSAPVWGRFADQSSRTVMVISASMTAATGLITAGVAELLPAALTGNWFLPAAYFLLSVAHAGVRVGRKTFVVDMASGNRRTDYVAIGNSVIGVLLLLFGSIGALASWIGNAGVIALLATLGIAGAALGSTLPDVSVRDNT
jgi:MFS family permease